MFEQMRENRIINRLFLLIMTGLMAVLLASGCGRQPDNTPREAYSESLFGDLLAEQEVDPATLGVAEINFYLVDWRGFPAGRSDSQEAKVIANTKDPQQIRELIHAFHRESRVGRAEEGAAVSRARHEAEWHMIIGTSDGRRTYARCIESKTIKGIVEVRGCAPMSYYVKCDIAALLTRMGIITRGAELLQHSEGK